MSTGEVKMKTFTVYTKDNTTYIVPKEKFKPTKGITDLFEIDSEDYIICTKKIKSPIQIKNLKDLERLINLLKISVPELKQ